MNSFLGLPLPSVTVSKHTKPYTTEAKRQSNRNTKDEYRAIYGNEAWEAKLHEDLAALQERKDRRTIHCQSCEKNQGEDEKFMRCKRCWETIQRAVPYCSKYANDFFSYCVRAY